MPDLDVPVVAAADEVVGTERVSGHLEHWAHVAELALLLVFGVWRGTTVDVAVHGRALLQVGVALVKVDRQSAGL